MNTGLSKSSRISYIGKYQMDEKQAIINDRGGHLANGLRHFYKAGRTGKI